MPFKISSFLYKTLLFDFFILAVYSFTFNPSLLTIPKRKQQVAEILKEAETYIWRIKEEMRCA